MPESPCRACGTLTVHTDTETDPLCDLCAEKAMWAGILMDIATGKIKVSYDESGRPIVPGVEYPD